MGALDSCGQSACCASWRKFIFKWKHAKLVWRYRWYYKWLCIVLLLSLAGSLVFYLLSSNFDCSGYRDCGFFANYECTPQSLQFILFTTLTLNWIWLIEACTAYLISLLLNMFEKYSQKDMMSAGKWATYVGALVKYLPWVVTLCHLLFVIISVFTILLISVAGICSNRYNEHGIAMVKNCRLRLNSWEACQLDKRTAQSELWSCNSIGYLTNNYYHRIDCELALANPSDICGIYSDAVRDASYTPPCRAAPGARLLTPIQSNGEDKTKATLVLASQGPVTVGEVDHVRSSERVPLSSSRGPRHMTDERPQRDDLAKDLLESDREVTSVGWMMIPDRYRDRAAQSARAALWLRGAAMVTRRLQADQGSSFTDKYVVPALKSDFSRYAVLWALGCTFVLVITILSLFLIKVTTPPDGMFYQPSQEDQTFANLYKRLTPWGE